MSDVREPIHYEESPFFMPYAPVVRAKAGGDLLFVSGCAALPVYHQHPHDLTYPVPESIADQTRLALLGVQECLQAAGAEFADLVRLDYFVTDIDAQDAVGAVIGEFFPDGNFPTSTMVKVASLVDPRLKIEINAIAVVHSA